MHLVDARGRSCPLPIVLVARALREIPVGEHVVVQADDRAFAPDVRAFCQKTGHALMALDSRFGYWEAVVRKSA